MIVPDINLLVYAYDSCSRFHLQAKTWWEEVLLGDEEVALLPVVLFGFVRLVTNRRIFENPLRIEDATQHVISWLDQPNVQVLTVGDLETRATLSLLLDLGTAGNLVTDAQIAAAALEHEAEVHTADMDFARFPGLRWINPLPS